MDSLAVNETPKIHLYQSLVKIGYILPLLSSNAVTIESLLRFKTPGYYCPFKDELRPYIRDPRKINTTKEYAFEMLKRFIYSHLNVELPFENCPNKDYIFSIIILCDNANKLKLLTEVYVLPQTVHQLLRGSQIIDFIEPSEQSRMQTMFDKLHNIKLKTRNKLLYYGASLELNNQYLREKRTQAAELISNCDEELKKHIKSMPSYKILFEDIPENELLNVVKEDFTNQSSALKLFSDKDYPECARFYLNKFIETEDILYKNLFDETAGISNLEKLNNFNAKVKKTFQSFMVENVENMEVENLSVESHGSRQNIADLRGVGVQRIDDDSLEVSPLQISPPNENDDSMNQAQNVLHCDEEYLIEESPNNIEEPEISPGMHIESVTSPGQTSNADMITFSERIIPDWNLGSKEKLESKLLLSPSKRKSISGPTTETKDQTRSQKKSNYSSTEKNKLPDSFRLDSNVFKKLQPQFEENTSGKIFIPPIPIITESIENLSESSPQGEDPNIPRNSNNRNPPVSTPTFSNPTSLGSIKKKFQATHIEPRDKSVTKIGKKPKDKDKSGGSSASKSHKSPTKPR
jgi:hypothetical protein